MAKYVKKPVEVEAFKWTGGPDQAEDPQWIVDAIKEGDVFFAEEDNGYAIMRIKTLEGYMNASLGDYIIKGIEGELYPCKPHIFELTYNKVAD